ncbi:hypothetical protein NPJ88_011495 [Halomonas elongata]|uniref:hypothetical protein n=1 Tax=Halomonas elongata TaxID=2746 RepID=UPI00255A7B26|nr:hypothetical protein [Halomonas elongata]MDL4862960.1 hypothetical protein [Halomonas elongata]
MTSSAFFYAFLAWLWVVLVVVWGFFAHKVWVDGSPQLAFLVMFVAVSLAVPIWLWAGMNIRRVLKEGE